MPWLYYDDIAADRSKDIQERNGEKIIKKSGRVKFRATFNPKYEDLDLGTVANLKFKVAKYQIDGTFVGWENLNDQMIMCPSTSQEITNTFRIGQAVDISCKFDLSRLIGEEFDRPEGTNYLYDIFLEDYNKDLIDVPVRMYMLSDAVE